MAGTAGMDYDYFASNTAQPYQYMGFTNDALLPRAGNDGAPVASLQNTLDANGFLSAAFDYTTFDPPPVESSGFAPFPSASVSPPPHQLSMLSSGSTDSGISLDLDNEHHGRRSSSEEKDNLTPAQSRRKAQNRAAQRAFRERKERCVRDLEAKLNLLTTATSSLQSDNERLKLMLHRAQSENEILRATAASSPSQGPSPGFVDEPSHSSHSRSSRSSSLQEPHFDTTRLAKGLLSTEASARKTSTSPGSHPEGHLLSASATWDLLQSHPLYLSGAVDIGEVCERLKKMARCDSTAPMFEAAQVRKAIEEVGKSDGDELV